MKGLLRCDIVIFCNVTSFYALLELYILAQPNIKKSKKITMWAVWLQLLHWVEFIFFHTSHGFGWRGDDRAWWSVHWTPGHPGLRPGQVNVLCSWANTFLSQCLSPPRSINGYHQTVMETWQFDEMLEDNLAMDWHPIQEGSSITPNSFMLRNWKWDKLQLDGPLGLSTDCYGFVYEYLNGNLTNISYKQFTVPVCTHLVCL